MEGMGRPQGAFLASPFFSTLTLTPLLQPSVSCRPQVTDEDEQVQSSVLVQGQAADNLRAWISLCVGGLRGEESDKPLSGSPSGTVE